LVTLENDPLKKRKSGRIACLRLSRGSASDVAVTRIDEMHAAASRAGHAFVNAGVFRCWRSRDDGLHGVPRRRAAI